MILAELNARGLPVQELIAQAAQTKSSFLRTSPIEAFLAKVEKDIPAQKLTSESFRAVALLAVQGNDRAMAVLQVLSANHGGPLANAYVPRGVELSEREANQVILHWALSSDKSEANFTSQIGDDSYRSSATGFYKRYVESPTKIELDIPVATTLDFSLLDVVDRADKGKVTEKDIENLVFAAKNGSRLAVSALKKAIVKMTDSRIKTSDGVENALLFGQWALTITFLILTLPFFQKIMLMLKRSIEGCLQGLHSPALLRSTIRCLFRRANGWG